MARNASFHNYVIVINSFLSREEKLAFLPFLPFSAEKIVSRGAERSAAKDFAVCVGHKIFPLGLRITACRQRKVVNRVCKTFKHPPILAI